MAWVREDGPLSPRDSGRWPRRPHSPAGIHSPLNPTRGCRAVVAWPWGGACMGALVGAPCCGQRSLGSRVQALFAAGRMARSLGRGVLTCPAALPGPPPGPHRRGSWLRLSLAPPCPHGSCFPRPLVRVPGRLAWRLGSGSPGHTHWRSRPQLLSPKDGQASGRWQWGSVRGGLPQSGPVSASFSPGDLVPLHL